MTPVAFVPTVFCFASNGAVGTVQPATAAEMKFPERNNGSNWLALDRKQTENVRDVPRTDSAAASMTGRFGPSGSTTRQRQQVEGDRSTFNRCLRLTALFCSRVNAASRGEPENQTSELPLLLGHDAPSVASPTMLVVSENRSIGFFVAGQHGSKIGQRRLVRATAVATLVAYAQGTTPITKRALCNTRITANNSDARALQRSRRPRAPRRHGSQIQPKSRLLRVSRGAHHRPCRRHGTDVKRSA